MCMDVHFTKGHIHDICEDYGLVDEQDRFMIVADGCSTGKYSDVAARILVHTCKRSLSYFLDRGVVPPYSVLGDHMLSSAITASQTMGLGALLSTVLVAFKTPFDIKVYVYGDGFVVAKRCGQEDLDITKIDYINNTPNYLWYRTNETKFAAPGCDVKINDTVFDRNHEPVFSFNPKAIESLSVFTDGVSSFFLNRPLDNKSFPDRITSEVAIQHLLAFKSVGGVFVKKRLSRFVKETMTNGFVFSDDISYATMVMP